MKVETIHGMGSYVEYVEGNMLIKNCNVSMENDDVETLKSIQIFNSIFYLPNGTTMETDDKGQLFFRNKTMDDFYREQGAVISIDGYEVYKIHPDNLENNFQALTDGSMKFGWLTAYEHAIKNRKKGSEAGIRITVKGRLACHINFGDNNNFCEQLDNGTLKINWNALLKHVNEIKLPALLNFD